MSQIEVVKTVENNGGGFFCSAVYIKTLEPNLKVQETPQEIYELIIKAIEQAESEA